MSMNRAIAAKFPDPCEVAKRIPYERWTVVLTDLQRDTINALADCLANAAARLESTNSHVTFDDLKREAQALRDYAETLVPAEPEAATR